jgi:hypothetical protein
MYYVAAVYKTTDPISLPKFSLYDEKIIYFNVCPLAFRLNIEMA